MEAQISSYSSYTQRSLLWGRDLLHHGSRWRFGNGQYIQIFGDLCIPHERFFRVHYHPCLPLHSTVSYLISDGGTQDMAMVYENFDQDEADAILSIPLLGDRNDHQIWHFNLNGHYTVKNVYWVAPEYRDLIEGVQTHSMTSFNPFWKQIQKVKITPKVSHLVQWVINECIPSHQNLQRC